jgi:hypothetical protein
VNERTLLKSAFKPWITVGDDEVSDTSIFANVKKRILTLVLRWSRDRYFFVSRAAFVKLKDGHVRFLEPDRTDLRGGSSCMYMNPHTLHSLTK